MPYEVIIVGGGPAGLSAALTLGRARRRVLLLDSGEPRNAPSDAAHAFLTRDGTPPSELRRLAREQLIPYGVEQRAVAATAARATSGGFTVDLADGTAHEARRLILATGVRDLLPDVPGLAERWGKSVHHCPYCHGWEIRDQPVAIYGKGDVAFHQSVLFSQWTRKLILLTDGPARLTAEQKRQLQALEIPVDERPVARLEGRALELDRVVFQDGGTLARSALLLGPTQEQRSSLPAQLGCALMPNGIHIQTDSTGQTSVPGVHAVGDMMEPIRQQVVVAATTGMLAAGSINAALVFEDAARKLARSAVAP